MSISLTEAIELAKLEWTECPLELFGSYIQPSAAVKLFNKIRYPRGNPLNWYIGMRIGNSLVRCLHGDDRYGIVVISAYDGVENLVGSIPHCQKDTETLMRHIEVSGFVPAEDMDLYHANLDRFIENRTTNKYVKFRMYHPAFPVGGIIHGPITHSVKDPTEFFCSAEYRNAPGVFYAIARGKSQIFGWSETPIIAGEGGFMEEDESPNLVSCLAFCENGTVHVSYHEDCDGGMMRMRVSEYIFEF